MIVTTIQAPGTSMYEVVNSARLQEGAGKMHGLTVNVQDPLAWEPLLEKPVQVSIQSGALVRQFHGYLDTLVPNLHDGHRDGHLLLLGLTKPMRSGQARTWRQMLPSQIAGDILNAHGLGLEIDSYDLKLPFFAQKAGKSDWSTLVALGDECGMLVHTQDAVVRMVHPEAELRRNMITPKATFTLGAETHLSMITSETPIGWEHRKLFGTDKFGKDFSIDVNPGSAVSLEHTERLPFLGDALFAAERLSKRNVLRRRAVLTTSALPTVRAGDCISTMDRQQPTDWLVVDVDVTIEGGQPQTKMALCRPATTASAAPAVRRTNAGRPGVVLANGKWRAQTHHRATL